MKVVDILYEAATLKERVFAFIIDLAFLEFISKALFVMFGDVPNIFIVGFLYFWINTFVSGQTLGKWVLGLQILTEDGDVPSVLRSFVRTLFLPFALFFVFLHDRMARTKVVRIE